MEPIFIGKNAVGKPISLTPDIRESTHMHVIGGSGTGKSKFLQHLIRQDTQEGHGVCLIDWHGTLYKDVLADCAQFDIGLFNDFRSLILVNPSQPGFVTGFNPFVNPGEDISTQVSNWIDATIKPWGVSNTNETPTLARIARILYTFMAQIRQTLPNAATLLEFDRPQLRQYAAQIVTDHWVKAQWRSLQSIKSHKDWQHEVLSTDNRLARFIGSTGVRRYMGLDFNNLDLLDIMDSGKVLLVNLGDSEFLDREAARVFASLFLREFFRTAMLRASRAESSGQKPKHYIFYLDEFQEYITDDIAAMLDQVRKGGLHMVLAHQHLGHFADNPKLKKSVFTNARIRAVFGGLDYEDACILGNEMFLPDLNTRQIKKAYYHTIHLYREETRTVRSKSTGRSSSTAHGTSLGSGSSASAGSVVGRSTGYSAPGLGGAPLSVEGWFSEGESSSDISTNASSDFSSSSESRSESETETHGESVVPVWVPIPTEELGSETEWSREEKLSKVAQMLKEQMQRHCFIKLDTEKTQPLCVPFVKDPGLSPQFLAEYEGEVYKAQGALPAPEVDRLIEESRQKFLATAEATVIDARSEATQERTADSKSKLTPKAIWGDWRTNVGGSTKTAGTRQHKDASRRQPGPPADVENHAKVAKIVRKYGTGNEWRTEKNLEEICAELDRQGVPVPKPWPKRKMGASRSWKRALGNIPDLVPKAIMDRIKMAKKFGLWPGL